MIRYSIHLFLILFVSSCSTSGKVMQSHKLISDTIQIKRDMDSIVKTIEYRNYQNLTSLNKVADFIKREFQTVSDSVVEQKFDYQGSEYKNIICSINTDKQKRIIIGAHYDVCGDQDGADDNASGVVGLLELARLLKSDNSNYRIDFVAYSLKNLHFLVLILWGQIFMQSISLIIRSLSRE